MAMEIVTPLIAVKALLDEEIMKDYPCEYQIVEEGECFAITFPSCSFGFNNINLKVNEIDSEQPNFSGFSINTYEDVYEEFTTFDCSIKEFWKSILWR